MPFVKEMLAIKHFEALVFMFKIAKTPQPSKAHRLRYKIVPFDR